MKHILVVLLPFCSSGLWGMDNDNSAYFTCCGVPFNKENKAVTIPTIIDDSYVFLTQSPLRNYAIYQKEPQTTSKPVYTYALIVVASCKIVVQWEDSHKWQYAAVNNEGTYIIAKREQDFWRKQCSYEFQNLKKTIHTITPIEKVLFPCFFLNETLLITYGKEKATGDNDQAHLYAWDIEEHFAQQTPYSKIPIIATPFYPKRSCSKWNDNAVIIADYAMHDDCTVDLSTITVNYWDVYQNVCGSLAHFKLSCPSENNSPIFLTKSSSGRYIACAYSKELFVKDSTTQKVYSRKVSSGVNCIKFKTDESEEISLSYCSEGRDSVMNWDFNKSSSHAQAT